jgi:tryptophan-associated transmembrane protein
VAEPLKRPLWSAVLALVAGAAALWGASRLSWAAASQADADAKRALVPLALVALAGVAGAVAVGGWARRVLGGLLVLAGAFAVWRGAFPGTGPDSPFAGRGLAMLGGLLIVVAGGLLAWFATRLPTMGARYRAQPTGRSGDPDKDLWDDLSAGADPTDEKT